MEVSTVYESLKTYVPFWYKRTLHYNKKLTQGPFRFYFLTKSLSNWNKQTKYETKLCDVATEARPDQSMKSITIDGNQWQSITINQLISEIDDQKNFFFNCHQSIVIDWHQLSLIAIDISIGIDYHRLVRPGWKHRKHPISVFSVAPEFSCRHYMLSVRSTLFSYYLFTVWFSSH